MTDDFGGVGVEPTNVVTDASALEIDLGLPVTDARYLVHSSMHGLTTTAMSHSLSIDVFSASCLSSFGRFSVSFGLGGMRISHPQRGKRDRLVEAET